MGRAVDQVEQRIQPSWPGVEQGQPVAVYRKHGLWGGRVHPLACDGWPAAAQAAGVRIPDFLDFCGPVA